MSWRQANNSWRLDEGSSWRSGVGWSGEYENRMTDHDKRCLTSFNNHWQLQFAVWRRVVAKCRVENGKCKMQSVFLLMFDHYFLL